jgi:hypothetical protein
VESRPTRSFDRYRPYKTTHPYKYAETNYRSGTIRRTTFFLFLGIVNLIGRLTHKLLRFLVFRHLCPFFCSPEPINVGEDSDRLLSAEASPRRNRTLILG